MTPLVVDGSPGVFGAGGSDPYDRALRDGTTVLELRDVRAPARPRPVAVARFLGPADVVDERVLTRARGPLLDVGCGPGRMVAAALRRGLPSLGIDVSATAVELARAADLPALHSSVFDPLPSGHRFATVLLLDGNVGIGGSPARLLARCTALLEHGGNLVAEVDSDPAADHAFAGVLHQDDGRCSEPFPWADVGQQSLARYGRQVGLTVVDMWSDVGRNFVELERGPGIHRAAQQVSGHGS